MSFVVAIDGPAGSGKGTITKAVAEKMDLVNIDTGAMYRCVALDMIEKGISIEEEDKIERLLNEIKIELINKNESLEILLNGKNVTKQIRTPEVTKFVSPVSTVKCIREKMTKLQRNFGKSQNIIMEGRDIGTTIFPNANVKIYLDATPEERARRRVKQNIENGIESNYEEILEAIKMRDKRDSTREISPLKKADDAIYIDSSEMTIDEVVEKIVNIIKERIK